MAARGLEDDDPLAYVFAYKERPDMTQICGTCVDMKSSQDPNTKIVITFEIKDASISAYFHDRFVQNFAEKMELTPSDGEFISRIFASNE